MTILEGKTATLRKKCLAALVASHLEKEGHVVEVVENRTDSEGRKDGVLVQSDKIGLIHVTATTSTDPNALVPLTAYKDGTQDPLNEKVYVAFGWNTRDGRTLIAFVPVRDLIGKKSLSKGELKRLSDRSLGAVLRET